MRDTFTYQSYLPGIKLPGLFLCLLVTSFVLSQDTVSQTIRFGTIPNENQKSLEPLYDTLKTAPFGTARFSIFEQLTEHFIKKGNTDSILKYGNLYQKELGNWDESAVEKDRYYAKAHYIMGVGNHFNGVLEKSIEWHIKGIQAAARSGFEAYEYKNKIGLAKGNLHRGDADKAIEIVKESIQGFSGEHSAITTQALILLGQSYLKQRDFERAEVHFEEALAMAKKFDDRETELTIALEKAKLAEAKEDLGAAFQGYEATRNTALDEGYTALYLEGSLLAAKLYYTEGMYETANIALSFAYINAIDRENLQFQREALEIQARSFAKLGDYKNGYAVITQLFDVLNQINSKQQKALIKELEIQYETLEKEQEISALEEEQLIRTAQLQRQKTIKNAFLIGFLIILIPILALLYVYYQKIQAQSELAKKQEEINQQKVTALKQEQELDLIRAAIAAQDDERQRIAQELHDSIGGNLAGIKLQLSSLTKGAQKYKTIGSQIDETYQLVRNISHTLVPKKFRQNAFTELIDGYAKSISGAGDLQVDFHPHPKTEINGMPEKLQMELFKIIQELMTNTLKHAYATQVDIHLSLIDNELSLLFEDNGKGFETPDNLEGIGLRNIKNRVSELSGVINIDSVPERGTVISVLVPNT